MTIRYAITPSAPGRGGGTCLKSSLRLTLALLSLLLPVALLSACGAPAAAPVAAAAAGGGASASLAQDYPNAIGVQGQLLVGTFRLEGTPNAITTQQAAQLVPYWQMLRALTTGNGSQQEIDAVLGQIQRAMTAEQMAAIRAMRLTGEDNRAMITSLGITPAGTGPGNGQPGQGAGLSEAEKATRRAEMGGSGQAGGGTVMLDKVIELLQARRP